MAFWGVEIKPGKSYTHRPDEARGRLRVSLATLGNGKATGKSVLQCNVGSRSPVLLCSLIPDQSETSQLKLEFEEDDDVVFSVIGSRSVHLSGFFLGRGGRGANDDESDSYGEDIGEDDSMNSYGSDEDQYESDFIDDSSVDIFPDDSSVEIFPSSHRRKSSVVIEEIVEDDRPKDGSDKDNGSCQVIVKTNASKLVESEDEDGFPISSSSKRKKNISNAKENTSDASKMVDECRKRKKENKSNHAKFAGEDSQLHCSSLLGKDGTENDRISRKKKKVQDLNSPPSLPKASSVEITCSDQDNDVDDKADLTKKHDAELKKKKKKKEKAKKIKTSEMGSNLSSGKKEKIAEGHSIEVDNTDGRSIDLTSEAENLPDSKEEGGSKKKKSKKNKRRKDENKQDPAGSSAEILASDQQASEGIKSSENDEKMDEDSPAKELPKDKVSDNNDTPKEAKKKKISKKHDKDSNRKQESPNLVVEDKEELQEPRILANGLTIEKLTLGKPDGKKASDGKKVFVKYIGKLKNGKIFDSTVGKSPFKFVLGRGQVIQGWDIGVQGMQVGEKRKLTIPPSLGYGHKKVGPIPANSWLLFDIELVDVK